MKKLITLTALLLCAVVSTWAATETTTATLTNWTGDTGSGGTLTIENNVASINCGNKGNSVTLTSDIPYKNLSNINLTVKVKNRDKVTLKLEIGNIINGVFTATEETTVSSSYNTSKSTLTFGKITINSKNKSNSVSGDFSFDPALSGYVRITMANSGTNTSQTGEFSKVKITAEPKTVTTTTLTGIKINGSSWDIAGLSDNKATIATEVAGPPTVQYIYTATYDDATSDTGLTEEVVASKQDGSYKATSTVFTSNYTLTFTNVSNTLFSMTNPTAPTEDLASKTGSDLTATFSPGGSAYVYNGKKETAKLVDGNGVNLAGSGDSYFQANFTSPLAAGDTIDCSDNTNTFYVWHTNDKSNSVTMPYTIPADSKLIGMKTVYVKKNGGSTFTSFTITRPKTIDSQILGGVKKGETTLTEATDYTVSSTTITLAEAHKAIVAPTDIKLINHITYDDASTEDQEVDVTLVENGEFFEGSATIDATTYTVKVPVDNTTPLLLLSAASGSINLKSYQPTGTATVTVTGANLANGTFNAPTAEGVTVTPASVEISDGTLNQEFTITSSATTAASTVLNFAYAGAATQSYTLSYTKVAQRGLSQTDVTKATTWDWKEAGNETIQLSGSTSPTDNEEFLMANLPEVNNDANFNSQALKVKTQFATRGSKNYFQGYSIKFNTTVAGTIDVTFSNTGNDRPYRYLRVNGILTDYKDGVGTMVEATGIAVPAGEVVIDFYIPDAADPQERSGDVVGTTMCRVNKIVFTPISASEVNVPVTAAGYATFCSDKALDFTGIEDITAYTATKEGNVVKFNKVMGAVPAETGLLVKGVTTNVPVAASAEDVTNIMKGTLTNTTIEEPGIFVLMNGAQGVGFYKTTKAFTVGANTAYLPANVVTGARQFIGFDEEGEATGIEAIERVQTTDNFFNLNGQRVAAPQKGIYIMNGKKVIKK